MQYRRVFVPGGTYFFTVVTFDRRKIFRDEQNVELLRQCISRVRQRHPFKVDAAVILPDHFHMIWSLPEEDCNYATRWRLIKSYFTRSWEGANDVPISASRKAKGEHAVWQRRYWEHLIRDEADRIRHVEYIHYNPVKHGLVNTPVEWQYSSFHEYIRQCMYPADWGAGYGLDQEIGME